MNWLLLGLTTIFGGSAGYTKFKEDGFKDVVSGVKKCWDKAQTVPIKETATDALTVIDEVITGLGTTVLHPIDTGGEKIKKHLGLGDNSDPTKTTMENLANAFTKANKNGEPEIDTNKALWTAIPAIGSFLFAKNWLTPDTPEHNTNWTMWLGIAIAAIGVNSYKDEISQALGLDKLKLDKPKADNYTTLEI